MLLHLRIRFPRPFRTLLMLPLNFDQRHHLVVHGFHLPIQNCHWSLYIIQTIVNLNIIQKIIVDEGVVDLDKLIRKIQLVCNLAYSGNNPEGADKSGAQLAPLPKSDDTFIR